jgi:serine/threonine protein kinase
VVDEADDEDLAALASAVLDGGSLECSGTESVEDTHRQAVIRQFQVLAEIVAVHRRSDAIPLQTKGAAPPRDTLGTWGPLHLLERIGQGAFGDVYRAWDSGLDREVALKLLRPGTADRSDPDTAIVEEGRLLAQVHHPNVLTVHGAERYDGRLGIWTEFIRGETLEARLRALGPLPDDEVISIGLDVCRALAAVHDVGTLHRDIKAANVMRQETGRIVLMDLGTGRAVADARADLSGTPLYLAPEIFSGAPPTVASDTYAVAVLLFHLLTGSYPVSGRTLEEVRRGHEAGVPLSVGDVRPDVPAALVGVIARGLAVNPAARYGSARAVEAALEGIQTTSTLRSRTQAPRWTSRRSHFAAIALAVTLVALSVGYVTLHRTSKAGVPFQARDWVLVTTFDNRTGDPLFNGTVEHALTHELSNSRYVNVVPRERVDDALRLMTRPPTTVVDAAAGPEVALRDGGIRLVLDGMIERVGGGYAMTVRVVEPRTAATIASDREEAPTAAAVPAAVRRLSNRIRLTVGEAPVTVAQDDERLEKVTTPSLPALRTYSEAVHAFNLRQMTEAEALLESALREDPAFASAHLRMAWTLQNLGRPRDEVIASARRAADLIETVTERERYPILGAYYRMTGRNAQATGQYEALATRYPDDAEGLRNLQQLYDLAGRRQEAADLMVRNADARPNDFFARVRAAQALLESRGIEAAWPHIARALRLLPTAPDSPDFSAFGPAKSWLLMFPAHDLWVQRRATKAAAVLDATSARPEIKAEGDAALNILGKLHLALGQLRLAESAYAEMVNPAQRAITKSEVALARGDLSATAAALSSYPGRDLAAVSLLVRAGDLGAADRLLRKLPNSNTIHFQWAAEEIAEARGDTSRVRDALKAGVPWTRVMTGARAFLYSETLARAAVKAGKIPDAIRVLEETGALGPNAYADNTQSGFYWMRTQMLLADLYRQTGRIDQARAIERDLLAALAAADDDYPLLVELKARAGAAPGRGTPAPH